jgi:hypothetical protein
VIRSVQPYEPDIPLVIPHYHNSRVSNILHSHPSLCRPSHFIPPLFTLHCLALHSRVHSRPSLPPFTPPSFTPALHCAALHPSPRRPSLPPFDSAARHSSFRLSSAFTPLPFTPALHSSTLHSCPSLRRPPPLTPSPFTAAIQLTLYPAITPPPCWNWITSSYGQGTERGYVCV